MSETYFIGCTHFGRSNIIRLGSRPFKDVNHMNESLVSNWNRVVQPDDRVFHLGDFGWHGSVNFRLRLNGQITYLRGNHDPEGWGPDMIDTRIYGRRVVMCHYPIEEWNGYYKGAIYIHAHTHKPTLVTAERRANVCVEAIDYTPISFTQLLHFLARAGGGPV